MTELIEFISLPCDEKKSVSQSARMVLPGFKKSENAGWDTKKKRPFTCYVRQGVCKKFAPFTLEMCKNSCKKRLNVRRDRLYYLAPTTPKGSMTKPSNIFKKPDYSHLVKEAENAVAPTTAMEPDFVIPELVLPENLSLTGEEHLQLQFSNALLLDRGEYAKACREALRIHIVQNIDPLTASERFAEAYAEFRRLLLIRDFTLGFFQMRCEIRTLEQEIAGLQVAAVENPLLKEHLETLKRSADELRSQLKDKEELLEFHRNKTKSAQAEIKRFQRTNKEVADIIYNATKNHTGCATLRWSESKISRLNSSCKNGGLGKDGYPGNTASIESIVMWAIQVGQRKEVRQAAADDNRQARFERSLVILSPEMLDKHRADLESGSD